jgi:hypothetical protein
MVLPATGSGVECNLSVAATISGPADCVTDRRLRFLWTDLT